MKENIKVLLMDQRETVRRQWHQWLELEDDIEVVGDYANAEAAFSQVETLSPNIVLLGKCLPMIDSIGTIRSLRKKVADNNGEVIILANSIEHRVEAPAQSSVPQDTACVELVQLITKVYREQKSLECYKDPVQDIEQVV